MPDLPDGLRIRTYETRDYDDVWRLHREGIAQTTSEYPKVLPGYEDDLRDIERTYLVDDANFWVVDATEGVVATTAVQRVDATTGRLRRMRVTTSRRQQGIAAALVETVLDFCRAHGYERCILDTTEHQTDAHRLYERSGFRRTGERTLGPFVVYDYALKLR